MPKKILVIDEDPDIVFLIKSRLAAKGYAVITTPNGEKGWEVTQRELPDLIVADIMMPKVNGWQFGQLAKDTSKTKHIPIIFLSAMVQAEGSADDAQPGDYLLAKPFNAEKLLKVIKQFLK